MRFFLVLLLACGSPATPVEEPAPPIAEAPAPIEEPPAPEPEPPPSPLAALIESMAETQPEPAGRTFATALDGCRRVDADECTIETLTGFDGGRWLVLEADRGEAGVESAALLRVAVSGDDEVIAGGPLDARMLASIRRALGRFRSQPVVPSLVRARATAEWSITQYAPLVALGAPLEGWLLYLETIENLDAPEHVLRLVKRDLSETIELARRTAPHTPCDGDMWFCDAHEGECTAAELRAEDRLCVQPFGIERVALAPDRATLFVGGTRAVAGHGGYPPFHYAVELPARAREIMAPP